MSKIAPSNPLLLKGGRGALFDSYKIAKNTYFALQKPFDLKNKKKTMPISIIGNIKSKDSFGVFKTLIIELR